MEKNCNCNETNSHGCNKPVLNCGCTTKQDLLCTYYGGEKLTTLNIENLENGESIIKKIDEYLSELEINNVEPTYIESIGEKIDIYKGLSDNIIHEIKSIRGEKGVIVEDAIPSSDCESADFINVKIDTVWLTNFLNEWIQTVDLCELITDCLPTSTGSRPINEDVDLYTDYLTPIPFTLNMIIPFMSDPDGDIVQARINTNTPNDLIGYRLNGFQYVGEWINISDISQLVFHPSDVPNGYNKSNKWEVKDSMGNISV